MNSRIFRMPQNPAPEMLKKFLELEKAEEKAVCCHRIRANRPMARSMKKGM